MWETNLQAVDGIIPWGSGAGTGGTEEQMLFLGGNFQLYNKKRDHVDPHPHGVVCEF